MHQQLQTLLTIIPSTHVIKPKTFGPTRIKACRIGSAVCSRIVDGSQERLLCIDNPSLGAWIGGCKIGDGG